MVALLDREIPAKGIVRLTGEKFTARQVRRARSGLRPDLAEAINAIEFNVDSAASLEKSEQHRKYIHQLRNQLIATMANVKAAFEAEELLWANHKIPSAAESAIASKRCMLALANHQTAVILCSKHKIFTAYDHIKQIKEKRAAQLNRRSKSRKQSQKNAIEDAAAIGAVA